MTPTNGRSTAMPSVRLDLGRFVSVRGPRADGTYRVLFELPPRLRPSGWSATTPLPINGERRGDLKDPDEVARIIADANALYQRYQQARHDAVRPAPEGRTIKRLIQAWETSQAYKATKPRTKKGYAALAREVQAWADSLPRQPDPTNMTREAVERFLALYDDRPTQRWQVHKALRLVMDQAVALGWRSDNPVAAVKVKMPVSRVDIWEAEDVEAYVWSAAWHDQPGLAAMILTLWETGQRLTDAAIFRREAEYFAAEGVFRFRQSKTAARVTIRVSARLRAILEAVQVKGSPYLFHDGATGRPFRDVDRISHVFEAIRAPVLANEGRHLLIRALRHSCVVQLARAGCEVPEIAAITGHSVGTVGKMLTTYLPRDSQVAENAQRKRGLI